MGKNIDTYKRENIDKIRIGSCIELSVLFDNVSNDFYRIKSFVYDNSSLLNNQIEYTIIKNIEDLQCVLYNLSDMILCDIDKENLFCDYRMKSI